VAVEGMMARFNAVVNGISLGPFSQQARALLEAIGAFACLEEELARERSSGSLGVGGCHKPQGCRGTRVDIGVDIDMDIGLGLDHVKVFCLPYEAQPGDGWRLRME